MRNKVKRTLSFLLTFVMLCSLLPAMALAKEPEGRYEEVAGVGALVNDAQVHVFTTKGAGNIELTGINKVETTFPQGSGYREYTATTNEGWVFDTWRYEQLQNGEDLGNREDEWFGTRYSFTNSGDNWRDPYTEGNTTISVNRLTTHGEVAGKPIIYNIYADFNPTITATAGENGTISGSDKPVEVEYGTSQAFDIKADTGYIIDTITVDGQEVAEGKNEESYTYTFENVIAPHTIDVTFRVKPDPGQCIVSYVIQGDIPADYQAPEADIVKEGETYTVKSVPEPVVDYEFSGWYDEDQNIVTEFTVTGDVTLTGIWTYTGEKDLWDTVYGTIRVYMDEGTEADFNNLPGLNLNKQVRLYSEKYLTGGYRLCGYEPINDFWYTTNAKGVTARDISEIVLAKDKLVGSSEKISIPMTGNDDYQVTVSEGEDKFGLIPYTYLKIEISKKEPVEETVTLTYDANGGTGAPETATVNKNTEDYVLNTDTTPTHEPVDGRDVEFKGWSADEAVINQVYEKDNVPATVTTIDIAEENVTVYAVWAYKEEPPVGTVMLNYDANGGTGAPASATVNKNTEVTLDSTTTPTHAEADGKYVTFAGWSNDETVKGVIYEKGSEPTTVDKVTVGETDVTVYAVWVYGDPVDPVDPPEPPTWDHSKDKTATELDNNFNSRVTLSLPSAEKELVSDVVFVLDKSSCEEDVTTEALAMLADLGASVKDTGSSPEMINIGHTNSPDQTNLTESVVSENAEKGTYSVFVSDASWVKAGDWVQLRTRSDNPDFVSEELGPIVPIKTQGGNNWSITETVASGGGVKITEFHQVKSVSSNKVTFYEPIMHSVNKDYNWVLRQYKYLYNVGIEGITFVGNALNGYSHHGDDDQATKDKFGWQYDGAYKPLVLSRVVNSWVRDVNFTSVSEAVSINESANSSAYNITIDGTRGHSAVRAQHSTRVFIGKVNDISTGNDAKGNPCNGQFHGCGVSKPSIGCVIWNSTWGKDACFESHATQPRATLFDNCRGGLVYYRAGGAEEENPNHLAGLTIWNLSVEGTDSHAGAFSWWSNDDRWWKIYPPIVVGTHGQSVTFADPTVQMTYEESTGTKVSPESLYEAQLEKRLGYVPAWLKALN